MIRIRLARGGKKRDPKYRIIAIEKGRKRSGKALDIIGFWDPKNDNLKFDKKLLEEWIKKGAQVSDTVKKLVEKK